MLFVSALFLGVSIVVVIYSHIWTDLGIVLMLSETKPDFIKLKALMDIMALHRLEVSLVFAALVLIITFIQIYTYIREPKLGKKIILIIFFALLLFSFSYPFLSKDTFTYLISAKLFYFYQQNPYTTAPGVNYDQDLWLTFTHWVHRKYVYGPIYLAYSLIPMVLFSAKRFLLNYLGLKTLNFVCFMLSGVILEKIVKNKYIVWSLWFVNPLIILELLINSHNDIVMLFMFYLAIYIFDKGKKALGLVVFISSILTKFISASLFPIFIIKGRFRDLFFNAYFWGLLTYILIKLADMQLWYLTWLYFAVPFLKLKKTTWIIFFIFQGLLILYKYYSFVLTGMWITLPEAARLLPYIYIAALLMFINQMWNFGKLPGLLQKANK